MLEFELSAAFRGGKRNRARSRRRNAGKKNHSSWGEQQKRKYSGAERRM